MIVSKFAVIGPSDTSSFIQHSISSVNEVLRLLKRSCEHMLTYQPAPILSIVPYKGIPVEAAKIYSQLGGEVHGLFDESLSNSRNFHRNKDHCAYLCKCPTSSTIEDYLINYVDVILVFGVSYGTMKELLSNKVIHKSVFMFRQCISAFPLELVTPLNIKIVSDVSDINWLSGD